MENNTAHIALENLQKDTGIKAKWKRNTNLGLDGIVEIKYDGKLLQFNAAIKKELRQHQLPVLIEQAKQYGDLMVVAGRIFPKIKQELRDNQIAYLETNGNIWLKKNEVLLWVDVNKPTQETKEKTNRAFTKTGLKVIYHFLLHEEDVNLPYRDIAAKTEVALGNINYVINGLKEMGFLKKLNKAQYKLVDKKELLEKWITAYGERLKPALEIGAFHFLKENDFDNWQQLALTTDQTRWGGEPGGDLLTNYLRPAELTLYTMEARTELIKNYRLVPDEKGNVKAYKQFWKQDDATTNVVNPLLVYADLIITGDRRCLDTAKKVYDEYLQDKF
ncbi:type IV toxin-antitoxin system AbiEi family antitoxin [Agriterribacter sp.]|uniref:type IV toxin-antitoxin system AbiEi family antitoxin n=1 Tax=Agriterribacter sp. TaxID=2821509 RepID=UPI002B9854B0|nr:type IV toxin-antitoxin system AbiEi family antitoxin [Agriterribacter sp.]HRO46461.1 type IV toxin-antitoxin system AbiEi family antitoxin [Agriterribacter sp.]HRQ17360.1 type IV toxin-antitoxin system AbiEi family antitoxin [Agriterribacter sp.]